MKTKAIELDHVRTIGCHISTVCEEACKMATAKKRPVHFIFNEVDVTAQPGESAATVEKRWDDDREAKRIAWINSPEYAERQKREAEELQRKLTAHMTESAQTEKEMREATVPWPLTKEQLVEYIESLVQRQHDYGTCVYAMSMAAVAAFYYVSHHLGVTGFQASCADLDILRRTRHLNGPFILLKGEDALYPQYDLPAKLAEAMESWKPWLKEQALGRLTEHDAAHPDVIAHWQELANFDAHHQASQSLRAK